MNSELQTESPPVRRTQATLADRLTASGRGLNTGRKARVRILPAGPDQGIRFVRTDRSDKEEGVAANWQSRLPQPFCTALGLGGRVYVRTVEHLLAALWAYQIDNARIEIDGEELPILDGSAAPWCALLERAGVREQASSRRLIRILRPFVYEADNRRIGIEPAERLELDVRMDLRGFGEMAWNGGMTAQRFRDEIAPARSFGRLKWAVPVKVYGFLTRRPILRGAGLGNVAPVWGGRILGAMRLPEEPVRHRVLDLMGDLALAGAPILGRVTAWRPGHDMNHTFLSRLMENTDCWE